MSKNLVLNRILRVLCLLKWSILCTSITCLFLSMVCSFVLEKMRKYFTLWSKYDRKFTNRIYLIFVIIQMPASKHPFYQWWIETLKKGISVLAPVLAPLKKWCSCHTIIEEFVWTFSWNGSELTTNLRTILLFVYKMVVTSYPCKQWLILIAVLSINL